MPTDDLLSEARRRFTDKLMAEPVFASLVAAAVSRTLPHLAGQPGRVAIDLFKEDGDNPDDDIYGLNVFDADNPPPTGTTYAQVPLLVFSAHDYHLSVVVVDHVLGRCPYGTATPALTEATSDYDDPAAERRRLARVFWSQMVAIVVTARQHGGDFNPITGHLALPPMSEVGLPEPDWQ